MLKRFLFYGALLAVLLITLCPAVLAQTESGGEPVHVSISGTGYEYHDFLTDGNAKKYYSSTGSCTVTVESSETFGALYLMFDLEYGQYTITDNITGQSQAAGQYSMLHEYVELDQPTTSVTLSFASGKVRLSEISAYTPGAVPEGVQVWQPPLEGNTDLLLLATHGDDDQLFFAGLLPLYAGELGYNVQVAYLTDHRNLTNLRTHEMINGLWAVGVRAYPVFGQFADFRIDDLSGTYNEYARLGTSKDELLGYVVEVLRRFKPQVVVGHDFEGEYGHGMHMVYTDLLVQALDIIGDENTYPESAQTYGTWEVQKTYIHLYEENPVVIDYDTPLSSFGGMTAFQVTQKLGYPCHETQQYTWFTGWINGKSGEITQASQIATYNPSNFGLYRSTVGEDIVKNDFMENIICYAEQERIEAERLEAERLEAERQEAERLEAERLAQEEAERLEAQQAAQEEAQRQEQQEQENANQRNILIACAIGVALVLGIILIILLIRPRSRRQGRYTKRRR